MLVGNFETLQMWPRNNFSRKTKANK